MGFGETFFVSQVAKASTAAGARRGAREAATRLRDRAQQVVDETAAEANAIIAQKNGELQALRQQVLELTLGKVVAEGQAAGLTAQRDVLKELGVNAPAAFEDSGRRFSNGEVKTKLRLVYEKAFDAYLISKGISNPSQNRKD